jgi:hypothetical protein
MSFSKYEQQPRKKLYAAGVLPIAFRVDSTPLFLVGEDIRGIGIADFGGKNDSKLDRNDPEATASREWYEESLGQSISINDMVSRFRDDACIRVYGRTQNGYVYHMNIVEIPWDPQLPRNFDRVVHFLRLKNISKLYVEKKNVMWLTFDELLRCRKRQVFESTVLENIDIIRRIGHCHRDNWASLCMSFNKHTEDDSL